MIETTVRIPCKVRSLQIPFLANTVPCGFHFFISWINPFLANSHGCKLWGLSLNIPFLAISTPFPYKFTSLQIQHPRRETDRGEGITTTTISLHLFICFVSRLAFFTHSPTPLALFCRRRPLPQTVHMVITWTAPRLLIISHRVSRPKKISPDADTTQYMQISPNSQ